MDNSKISAKDAIAWAITYNWIIVQFIALTNIPEEDVNNYFIKMSYKHKELTLWELWEKIKQEYFTGKWDINNV